MPFGIFVGGQKITKNPGKHLKIRGAPVPSTLIDVTLYTHRCHPPAISIVFPITEFCNQLALGVFQILKALI